MELCGAVGFGQLVAVLPSWVRVEHSIFCIRQAGCFLHFCQRRKALHLIDALLPVPHRLGLLGSYPGQCLDELSAVAIADDGVFAYSKLCGECLSGSLGRGVPTLGTPFRKLPAMPLFRPVIPSASEDTPLIRRQVAAASWLASIQSAAASRSGNSTATVSNGKPCFWQIR